MPSVTVSATAHASNARPQLPSSSASSFSAAAARATTSEPIDQFPTSRRPSQSSTHSAMGQAESAARSTQQPAQPQQPTPSSGGKLRFGWPGRRKKSEDLTKLMASADAPFMPLTPPSPVSTPSTSWGRRSKGKGNDMARQDSTTSHTSGVSTAEMHELSRPPSRSSARQLSQFATNKLSALKGRLNASQSSFHSQRTHGTPPVTPLPPLPTKPDMSRVSSSSSSSWFSTESSRASTDERPAPESQSQPAADAVAPKEEKEKDRPLPHVPDTPNFTGAQAPIQQVTTATSTPSSASHATAGSDSKVPMRRERRDEDKSAKEIADDWRKSDSTLRTVRLVGSRTPRPLSLAESTNSGHTVHAGTSGSTSLVAGTRLSALVTDAEFGVPEVDSEDDEEQDTDDKSASATATAPPSAFHSTHNLREKITSSVRSRSASPALGAPSSRRGSLSIRIGKKARDEAAPYNLTSGSDSEVLSSSVSTGLHTASSSTTSVISSPFPKDYTSSNRPSMDFVTVSTTPESESSLSETRMQQYAQYNSKLDPWIGAKSATASQTSLSTSTSTSSNANVLDRQESPSGLSQSTGPTLRPAHQRTRLQSIQARGFRQTAVNFTSKAVDKLGKSLALLGAAPGAEQVATQASSTPMKDSNSTKSEQSRKIGKGHRTLQSQMANPSHPPVSKLALRRHAQNASSGTWSIGSASNSASDTDGPSNANRGPNLGRCVRPSRPNTRGLVFGRDLASCVRETACVGGAEDKENSAIDTERDAIMEKRLLPALVLRCAQHILKWGIQEEGLFRISGRSTHVSKIRSEFDAGGDYDLLECGPGEIDPHAVSSILKAYLRELPEPLLTRQLTPYFEAALSAEIKMTDISTSAGREGHQGLRAHGPGLPSNPRAIGEQHQLRKAPSLSTFAVPTLNPRTASVALINAITSLIARLPRENRDLLRTVAEVITATASASAETKMPLSNLLLVFCPSMMMSPPLLRVLCEGKGIWDGPPEGVVINVSENLNQDPEFRAATGDNTLSGEGILSETAIDSNGANGEPASADTDAQVDAPGSTAGNSESHAGNGSAAATKGRGPTLSSLTLPLVPPAPESDSGTSAGTPSNTYSPPGPSLSSDCTSPRTPSNTGCAPVTTFGSPSGALTLDVPIESKPRPRLTPLRSQSDLPSPSGLNCRSAIRKSLIGAPVPFPLGLGVGHSLNSGNSAPVTPIEHAMDFLRNTSRPRGSVYSSSSPNLQDGIDTAFCFPPMVEKSSISSPATPAPEMSVRRRKSKASLLGLKAKRSISSLFGLAQVQGLEQAEGGDADKMRARSPVQEMTMEELGQFPEPPPRSSTPCPVLSLPVDTSRMQLGLGLNITDEPDDISSSPNSPYISVPARTQTPPTSGSTLRVPVRRPSEDVLNRVSSDSSAVTNSIYHTPPTTTRALAPVNSLSTASSTSSGSCSFLDFNIGSGPEDDWASSVLLAASSSTGA